MQEEDYDGDDEAGQEAVGDDAEDRFLEEFFGAL